MSALSGPPSWEDTAIGALSLPLDLTMEDKVDAPCTTFAVVATLMSIDHPLEANLLGDSVFVLLLRARKGVWSDTVRGWNGLAEAGRR